MVFFKILSYLLLLCIYYTVGVFGWVILKWIRNISHFIPKFFSLHISNMHFLFNHCHSNKLIYAFVLIGVKHLFYWVPFKTEITYAIFRASQVGLVVKDPPDNQEMWDAGSIPGWEDPLKEGMATHSSILA